MGGRRAVGGSIMTAALADEKSQGWPSGAPACPPCWLCWLCWVCWVCWPCREVHD